LSQGCGAAPDQSEAGAVFRLAFCFRRARFGFGRRSCDERRRDCRAHGGHRAFLRAGVLEPRGGARLSQGAALVRCGLRARLRRRRAEDPHRQVADVTPGGGFAIRPLAEGDDLQALLDLVRGVFSALKVDPPSSMARETIDDMRRRARTQTIFVAEADGALVGGVFCERQGDAFYIGRLAVIEPWRRRGVASALVGAATAKARELGLRTMSLRARV